MSKTVQKSSSLRALSAAAFVGAAAIGMANPAQAAAPRVGWVWANNPTTTATYAGPAYYSYNSQGGAITITRSSTGVYTVAFLKMYTAAGTDDVQVTAYGSSGYCTVGGWTHSGTTIEAAVHCFDATGAAADTEFDLLYQKRSAGFGSYAAGIGFLWADNPTAASYTPSTTYQYNSTGATNTITRSATGTYKVDIPDLDPKRSDVQVTAYASSAARCKVSSWYSDGSTGTDIVVHCFDSTGTLADEQFDLAYGVDESFGRTTPAASTGAWAYANKPVVKTAYEPLVTYQYNGFGTGKLTAQRIGNGLYSVSVPGSPSYSASNLLVTEYGNDNSYCNVDGWSFADSTLYVECFAQGGKPDDVQFDVGYQTAK